MPIKPEEQDEIDRLRNQIDATFAPLTSAWADGTSKNVLDRKLAEAEELTKSAKARIAAIKRNVTKRDR